MRALKTFFGSPARTAMTFGAGFLTMSAANTIYDCATGNCNKTPEEIQRLLHIQNAAMSVFVEVLQNVGLRVVLPVVSGIFAGAAHEITNKFCRKTTNPEQTHLLNGESSNNTAAGGAPADDTAANTAGSQNNFTETAAAPGSAA